MDIKRFIILHGTQITILLLALGITGLVLLLKKNRYFIPNSWKQWTGSLLIFTVIIIAGIATHVIGEVQTVTKISYERIIKYEGESAPEFSFTTFEDSTAKSLDDFRGQVVILNFWATWCYPCVKEIPALNEIAHIYSTEEVRVICISDESPEAIRKFTEKRPIVGTVGLINPDDKIFEPYRQLRGARPVTFIIDSAGTIRYATIGAQNHAFFHSAVQRYLKERT
ncbi:MAG: redoxin domain-containing protein [Candidatus Marinimicrobia bacterium]|nr:redoxin domain-containing protein [Candidatus Neomarinimicrobiota bacterium]